MFVLSALWFSVLGLTCANIEVSVIRLTLPHEQQYTITLNHSVEYLLDFTQTSPFDRPLPSRFQASITSGDLAYPVIITARERAGAESWQLPYSSSGSLQYKLQRTLCENEFGTELDSECAGNRTVVEPWTAFSVHVATSCAVNSQLTVLATLVTDWYLPFEAAVPVLASQIEPQVFRYNFTEEQKSVRIAFASEDNACAVIRIVNNTCPIPQTTEAMGGVRMTMLQSAGAQFFKSDYPRGFLVVVMVSPTQTECLSQAEEADQAWLYQHAVLGDDLDEEDVLPLNKSLSITVKASLTPQQYIVASAATLTVFLLFYASFLGLVCLQRLPSWAKLVAPLGISGTANTQESAISTLDSNIEVAPQTSTPQRQRRDSNATFDSSDNSDTDDEMYDVEPTPSVRDVSTISGDVTAHKVTSFADHVTTDLSTDDKVTNGQAEGGTTNGLADNSVVPPAISTTEASRPYGLPSRLYLSALSRRRERVLRARSDRYLTILYTVAVFYSLPVLQFVSAFQLFLIYSGSLDTCYYNFLCAHPAGQLSDFNHVFSNLGYLLLGALFMIQVRRRRKRRKNVPKDEEYGIPAHYGLLSSLGAGMMVVALLSASYHICPNRLNFQFDTSFMYVLSVLSMVKIYQSRHPDVNARAHATFGVLAVLIALVVWGVLGGGALFWAFFTVIHLFTFMLLSLNIYYVGQFRLEKDTLRRAARELTQVPKFGVKPLYKARLTMLLLANFVNWIFGLYALWSQEADFASHLLKVLLGNTLLYMIFYLVMKWMHGERPRWYAWMFLAGAAVAWAPALYYFVSGSSDWSTSPALSRHKNHECYVLRFYDSHDLWHMLSAIALYLSFNAMMTWDDGLGAVKRSEIAVF